MGVEFGGFSRRRWGALATHVLSAEAFRSFQLHRQDVGSLREGHSGLRGEGKGRDQNGFVEDSKGISLSSSGRFI